MKVKCILRGMIMNCTPNCDTFKKITHLFFIDSLSPAEYSTTVTSPNYPGSYLNGASNSWLYSAPSGSIVILVFNKFSVSQFKNIKIIIHKYS